MAVAFCLDLVLDVEGCHATAVVLGDGAGNHVGAAVARVCVGNKRYLGVKVGHYFGVAAHVVEGCEAYVCLAEIGGICARACLYAGVSWGLGEVLVQGASACHVDAVKADFEGDSRAEAVVYSGRYDDVLGGEHVSELGGCGGTACRGGFHFVTSCRLGILVC